MDIDYEDNNRSYDELPTKEQNLKFTVLEEKMKNFYIITLERRSTYTG